MRVPAMFAFVLFLNTALPGCSTTASAKEEWPLGPNPTFEEMANYENQLREELYLKRRAQ